MKKLIALVAVVALVALAVPAVTMAANGKATLTNWKFWGGPKTPTGTLTATAPCIDKTKLSATVDQAVAKVLGRSTQDLANLERKYNVRLGEIVSAQAIVTSTASVDLDSVLQYMTNHTLTQTLSNFGVTKSNFEKALKALDEKIITELKNLGVNTKDWRGFDKVFSLGKELGKFKGTASGTFTPTKALSGQVSATVDKIVASVLNTSTQNLSNMEKTYNVGLGEIIKAEAIATATTKVSLDSVLNYMTNHTLMQTLNYYGVTPDKFNASLKVLADKINTQLKSAGINVPGWLDHGLGNGFTNHKDKGRGNW
jgi:hypothetical protein